MSPPLRKREMPSASYHGGSSQKDMCLPGGPTIRYTTAQPPKGSLTSGGRTSARRSPLRMRSLSGCPGFSWHL
ncbi:unnamed protein product [Symbiodinium sp. CCMP2592]|nr:unnamed protein product [Symbiodinium sp. CCMP2592]